MSRMTREDCKRNVQRVFDAFAAYGRSREPYRMPPDVASWEVVSLLDEIVHLRKQLTHRRPTAEGLKARLRRVFEAHIREENGLICGPERLLDRIIEELKRGE